MNFLDSQTEDPFTSARRETQIVRDQLSAMNEFAFDEFLRDVSPTFTWNWRHQLYLYKFLERVTDGDCKRLMIFMPPRHGKSVMATVHYAAYRLERNPATRILIAGYSQKIANRFSRQIKRKLTGRIEFADDKQSSAEWETSVGGGILAVGVGGGVTSYGFDLIIIDDPVKSRAQAESETYRERAWEWFNDDVYTRLEPGGALVLINTRWHDDDLSGRLLKESSDAKESGDSNDAGESWEVVSLPAIAESNDALGRAVGEALCPARYDEDALRRIKRKLGSYSFAALFQQNPVPSEGALFKSDWFKNKIIAEAPPNLRWSRGYDLAVSTKSSADYTASFAVAFDKLGNMYIKDGFRKQIEYPEQRRYVIGKMRDERNTQHGIESALHGLALVQDLRRIFDIRGVPLRPVRVDTDKYTRALAWANLAEEGKVYLVRGPWIKDFLDEVTRFPNGAHDDQVDGVSLAVQMQSQKRGRITAW